jgi:hypothetical protein
MDASFCRLSTNVQEKEKNVWPTEGPSAYQKTNSYS